MLALYAPAPPAATPAPERDTWHISGVVVDEQGKPKLREVSEHKCPVCGREMIKRRGRFGEFLGCSGYSIKKADGTRECSTIINLDKQGNPMPPKAPPVKTSIQCPKCGGMLLLRGGKRGPWLGCSNFPKCRGKVSIKKLEGAALAQAEALVPLLNEETAKAQALVAKIAGPPAAGPPASIATDIDCEECGKPMVIRNGRRGRFLGCSRYPKCRNTADVPAKMLEDLGLGSNGAAGKESQKSEVGSQKVETGEEESEVGSQKSEG